eukprot:TRINITY_DN7339_c0_g1_i1.p1 TRINITY_DN7339_c0_g1~~TRINITY_DN7339_c0_g1_i1.p1  ORF type:complete len:465 (-),score=92.43 TRINITY_DN7339_c0_g1_i1:202-1596(-)
MAPQPVQAAQRKALAPVLAGLAAQPGKFQNHARAALRFRCRRRRWLPAEACEVVGPDLQLPNFPRSISDCGIASATCTAAGIDSQSTRSCEVLGEEEEEEEEATRLKTANSEPHMFLDSEGSHKLFTSQTECMLEVDATVRNNVDRCPATSDLRLVAGSHMIPHPEKASGRGADSCFIAPEGTALGVADGVGEWEWRFKCNPRAFADELMQGSQELTSQLAQDESADPSEVAQNALRHAFNRATSIGSSTALVASLSSKQGLLGVANVGDSSLLHLRRHRKSSLPSVDCVARTREQQHSFNCPYQLCCLPTEADFPRLIEEGKHTLVRAVKKSVGRKQDQPEDAETYTFQLQEGDLLVLGTDGLFDNLHDHEICQLVSRTIAPFEVEQSFDIERGELTSGNGGKTSTSAAFLAETLAQAALQRSCSQEGKTPFSLHAQQAGLYHVGGKMDDITCVCAWVVSTSC